MSRKYTWSLAVIIAAALFITACHPNKQITKISEIKKEVKDSVGSTKIDAKVETQTTAEAKKQSEKSLEQIEKETANLEAILITYDTDKPIDNRTGKPPIKSELTIRKGATIDRKTNSNQKTMESEKSDSKSESTKSIHQKTNSKTKTTQDTKTSQTITPKTPVENGLIVGLFILIILAVVILKRTWIIKTITKVLK